MSISSYVTDSPKHSRSPRVANLLGGLCLFAVLTSITHAQACSAQNFPVQDQLRPPAESEEGEIYLDEQLVTVCGTDDNDKIVIKIRKDHIRFEINGESSTLDEDDYPSALIGMGPQMTHATIAIAGHDGHDDIEIIDELQDRHIEDVLNELSDIEIVVLGGPGDDRLTSNSVTNCTMVGGTGRDWLVGGAGETMLAGGILSCPSLNTLLFASYYPDLERDLLVSGGDRTHLVSQWFIRYEPLQLPTNVHQVVGNRHLVPTSKVSIVSREKAGFEVSPPPIIEDIRIEIDGVWEKGLCVNTAIVFNESMEQVDSFMID
ncbi:calcium-binding protein [Planctomycetes bacterium K23_9]|uniref:Uncharacterized protein n=1 Tax=Stieleria marina TaxID=1930275 RepID=A0A517NUJ8_9BACT|nr:hypothetical protein K239x_27810 [Planctomycetes bacterium K23_9]